MDSSFLAAIAATRAAVVVAIQQEFDRVDPQH
jgi:hypothetical protein